MLIYSCESTILNASKMDLGVDIDSLLNEKAKKNQLNKRTVKLLIKVIYLIYMNVMEISFFLTIIYHSLIICVINKLIQSIILLRYNND